MSSVDIILWVFSRANKKDSIADLYAEAMRKMVSLPPPLGFSQAELPATPDCGDGLSATFSVKKLTPGIKFIGNYKFRGERYSYEDRAAFDDSFRFGFKSSNKGLNYASILREQFPRVIEAFGGYRAFISYGLHDLHYASGGDNGYDSQGYPIELNEIYNQLRRDKSIDIDGRNNIYTLRPAMYWDDELCRRALGFGADEVIARLRGEVPVAERLMSGVYLVLNDDLNLSYQGFVEMNERIKPMLGLR